MATFEINLMRHRSMSADKRRAVFWALALYLVVCIVVLAFVANRATRRLVSAQYLRSETQELEARFRRRFPEAGDILSYARTSAEQMDSLAGKVERIDELLAERISLAGLLSGIAAPLPPDVHVFAFRIDERKQELVFDILVPAGGREKQVTVSRLAAMWADNEALMARAGRIRPVVTQRHQVEARDVVILRFACTLKKEAS